MDRVLVQGNQSVLLRADGTWEEYKPSRAAIDALSSIEQSRELVNQFSGLFREVGIRIRDTGEEVTCRHLGDRIEFAEGIDDEAVDFVVDAYSSQVEHLVQHVANDTFDESVWFRIARTLLTQSVMGRRNVLNNPLMSNPILRSVIGGKRLAHVYLVPPETSADDDATFSLVHVNGRWLLIPGLHGDPQRTLRVTVADALELQRHLFEGMSSAGLMDWIGVARWYRAWRNRVEVPTI